MSPFARWQDRVMHPQGEMLQTCRDEHGLTNADRKVIFFKVAMLALAVFTLIPAAAFIVAATVPLGLSLLITAAVVTVLAAALTGLLAKGWSDAINERAHLASRTLLTGATT